MKIALKDCIQLDSFRGAEIITGGEALEHVVKSVSVLEAGGSKEALSAVSNQNELVISSFMGIENDEAAQIAIIKALSASDCAGLLLLMSDGFSKLAPNVADVAQKESFAVMCLEKSGNVSTGAIIGEVMNKILYGDNFGNKLISNSIFHLLNFERHSDFQSALHDAAVNNDFQVVIVSEDFNPIMSVETRHRASIDDMVSLGLKKDVNKGGVYTLIDFEGVLAYWGPINIADVKYYMFIVDNDDNYSAGEITKLAEIIELAMGMWKFTPERNAKSEFIKALRRGNKSLAYSLKEECGISAQGILSVFYARGIERVDAAKLISSFERKHGLSVYKVNEGVDTYGIIVGNGSDTEKRIEARQNCIQLYNELKEEKSIRIFHVTGLDGIEGAGDAYRLISEAWSFAQIVFPYKRVFTKYELNMLSTCINIQLQGGFVKKNCTELLDAFSEIGENKGKQLLDTLETFVLDAGMNGAKTAEFMRVHANTVQYRLKRINDILGVEITANRVIPGLTMALALKRLEKVIK